MPAAYAAPQRSANDGRTVVQGVTSDNAGEKKTFFGPPGKGGEIAKVYDGSFSTVILVQTDSEEAVDWMRPADWRFDPQNPRRGLGKLNRGGFYAVFASGAVRFISNKISDEGLRALFTVNGGEVIDDSTLPTSAHRAPRPRVRPACRAGPGTANGASHSAGSCFDQ